MSDHFDMEFTAFSDGGSRGNPGPAACAAWIVYGSRGMTHEVEVSQFIGIATNNEAEYRGLLMALKTALVHGAKSLQMFMDSELVVKQMRGEYRVKDPKMKLLHEEAKELVGQLNRFQIDAVRREENKRADALVNKALDSVAAQ